MPDKPRNRLGYSAADTSLVRSACLTVAVTIGAYLDEIVIVGGLVPTLLIDVHRLPSDDHALHPGTNDLDLGLSLALLDDARYAEVSQRLRAEGFEPDENDAGNRTVQRWKRGGLKVDFLIPPAPNQVPTRRVHNLEPDFGAIVTPGLELAFEERVLVEIAGATLTGEHATRTIPVSGPGAFVVLKALAFGDRGEPKDAYDLIYVIRYTPGGAGAVAKVLKQHAVAHADVVEKALMVLARDFASVNELGPRRAAEFEHLDPETRDDAAADAHGYIDDLLTSYHA